MDQSSTEPPWDIRARTLAYAVRAVRLFRVLEESGDAASRLIGKQFLRSATSIGANVAEAQSAESAADFVHKYGIAQKEARESLYWLPLMDESNLLSTERLQPLRQETNEIVAIITTIIVKKKRAVRK